MQTLHFLSSMRIDKPFQRIQLVRFGKILNTPYDETFKFLLKKIENGSDRLNKNYTFQKLDLKGHLTFDLLVSEGHIVAFSGIYNGDRYPKGIYRVLNRTYVTPEFRSKSIFDGLNSKYLLPLQLEEFKGYLDIIFVSRQGMRGKHFLRKWIKTCAPLGTWLIPEEFIQVANGISSDCFQNVAILKIDPKKFWSLRTISVSDWKKLKFKSNNPLTILTKKI